MDGTRYDPDPRIPPRCTRAADRKAVVHAMIMTAAMIVAVLIGVVLTAACFPWMLEPSESWLAYAATMQ